MPGSTYSTDLSKAAVVQADLPQPLTIEQLRQQAQETTSRLFAAALPAIATEIIDLALNAEKEDVRLRAGVRVLGQFEDKRQVVNPAGTTVQILQNFQIPESRVVGGKESSLVEIAGTKIALPEEPKKTVILPDQQPVKRQTYLGPKTAAGMEPGPRPAESPTEIKKG